jgi:membrane protein YdbS with pleckstrin-like domain
MSVVVGGAVRIALVCWGGVVGTALLMVEGAVGSANLLVVVLLAVAPCRRYSAFRWEFDHKCLTRKNFTLLDIALLN